MDTSFQFQVILFPVLALFIFYSLFLKAKPDGNKKTSKGNIEAPEPAGAWPIIGHLPTLGGQTPIVRTVGALADKLGPIFTLRLGLRKALIISDWELVKETFTVQDMNFANRPSIAAGVYMGYNNAVFALAPYGAYWRDIRKLATLELLSTQKVEQLVHVRTSEINYFIKDLGVRCAKSGNRPVQVAMDKVFEVLTFNNMTRVVAGKRYTAAEYSDPNHVAWRFEKAMKQAMYLSGVFSISDVVPYVEWMDIGGYIGDMKKTAKKIDDVLQLWLEEHKSKRNSSSDGEDFMDKMLSILKEDTEMGGHKRDNIVKATAMILIFTGSDSPFIALEWALSLLLNNPHVLKRAQEEIDTHVGKDRWVLESDIKNLNYLQAIVKETLRLYPPSPLTGIREAAEDCYLGGYFIPKKTRLLTNIWKLHRDPRVWPEPEEFRPERFLNLDADADLRDDRKYGYAPFGHGRRSCAGTTFGLHTVQLTLACLIQGFDMTTVGGLKVDMSEGLGLALPKKNPIEAVISPRLPLDLYENL